MTSRLRRLTRPTSPARPTRALTSVIIPVFNQLRYTKECLRALSLNTTPPHEIIVVDNGSTDGTAEFVRSRRDVRLIRNPRNLGFAKAINQGMRAAKGRYLVWLNNDVVVSPGWLEGLVSCASGAPWIGAVGPVTNEANGPQRAEDAAYPGPGRLALYSQAWALRHQGQRLNVPRLTGFCFLVTREAYRRVGPLDERFGLGCYEEYDYCLRLRQAGYELVCARDVFVHHYGHKSFANREAWMKQVEANREVFLEKWCHQALGFLDELDPEAVRP